MKKLSIFVMFVLAIVSCTTSGDISEDMMSSEALKPDSQKKITICHKDNETISISVNALQAHLDHGDEVGPCGSRYTYVPDDNFETYLIEKGYDEYPLDNLVPTENIKGITTVLVSDKNIADLTGIQEFISLESLDVSLNDLTWIDLSNNSELITLIVHNNSLTELDASNKPKLVNLIAYRNKLEKIIFNNTPSLVKFSCSNNRVMNLDLSQNSKLTHMWLHNNNLESLSVNNGNNLNVDYISAFGNPKLFCIKVDDPAYSNSNWADRKDAWAEYKLVCVSPE